MTNKSSKIVALAYYNNYHGNVTDTVLNANSSISMASDRLQLLPALKAAQTLEAQIQVLSLHSNKIEDIFHIGHSDICLVTKMSANKYADITSMANANYAAITWLKKNGAKIVIQYCDNLIIDKPGGIKQNYQSYFYKSILGLSDFVVFPSQKLSELTRPYLSKNAHTFVIKDPWQIEKFHKIKPLEAGQKCRLIWFGNNKNISYLIDCMPDLLSKSPRNKNFILTILGRPEAHNIVRSYFNSLPNKFPNWKIRLVDWDPIHYARQLEEEIAKAHIAIIPSDPKDPQKAGVSHNRLVDAAKGGCITIASPMASYSELSEIALLGNNMGELLSEAIGNYNQYSRIIDNNRKRLLMDFAPSMNKREWTKLWSEIINQT